MSLLDKENDMWYLVSHPEELDKLIREQDERDRKFRQAKEEAWNKLSKEEQESLILDPDAYLDFLDSLKFD